MGITIVKSIETLNLIDDADPYQRLAAGVIMQALEDATTTVTAPHSHSRRRLAERSKPEARAWFTSAHCQFWFKVLLPNADLPWHAFCEQAMQLIEEAER